MIVKDEIIVYFIPQVFVILAFLIPKILIFLFLFFRFITNYFVFSKFKFKNSLNNQLNDFRLFQIIIYNYLGSSFRVNNCLDY
jgi:hypothetical protein